MSLALAAVPTSNQKSGMTIRYVQSSDNKYVQYVLMKNQWSTSLSDWLGINDTYKKVFESGVLPLSDNSNAFGHISDKKWVVSTSNSNYAIIPIESRLTGENIVTIKAHATNTSIYGFLRSFSEPHDGDDVEFTSTYDDLYFLSSNTEGTYRLNVDVKFIYINLGENLSRLPQKILYNGYDLLKSIFQNFDKQIGELKNITSKHTDTINTNRSVLLATNAYPLSSSPRKGYIDTTNGTYITVNTEATYTVIPVNPMDKLNIVPNANYLAMIAYLKSYTEPSNGDAVDFSDIVGGLNTYNSAVTLYIPNDTHYIFIYNGINNQFTPQSLIVNDYNYSTTPDININDNADKLKIKNQIVQKAYQEYTGYIDTSTNKFVRDIHYRFTIVPILPGEEFEIKTGSKRAAVAILTSDKIPANGESVSYSSVTGFTTVNTVYPDSTYKATAPQDAAGLYIQTLSTNVNYGIPDKCIITGYDVLINLRANIQNIKNDYNNLVEATGAASAFEFKKNGYIDPSTGKYADSQTAYFAAIPVKADSQIIIHPVTGIYHVIALLKSLDNYADGGNADFSSVTGYTTAIQIYQSYPYIFNVPNDATLMYVYLGINNNRVPSKVLVDGYNVLKNVQNEISDRIKETPQHLRVVQYNIGKYYYGSHTEKMSEELYQSKIENYKKFFSHYKPDVACIQEYVEYMDANDQHPANDVLYNYLFKYQAVNFGFEKGTKSKFPIIYSISGLVASDTYPEQRGSFMESWINFGGKIVKIINAGLTSVASDVAVVARQETLTKLINRIDDADYAIIALDMNNQGNGSTLSAAEEGVQLRTLVATLGWEAINNGYYGSVVSISEGTPLDNVIYKNNGRIVFENFEVLADEYEKLSSDHYPVIADFVLV